MRPFEDTRFWDRFVEALNGDALWRETAWHYPGRWEVGTSEGLVTIDVRDGRAVSIARGPHRMGARLTVRGEQEAWDRLLRSETDWFKASQTGDLEVSGDVVGAFRNVRALWRFVELAQSLVGAPPPPAPAADAVPSGAETTGRYIDVGGLRVHVEVAGSGRPIICFHAAGTDGALFRNVLAGLSDRYRVIAVDAPAHGRSSPPEGGAFTRLEQFADFLEATIAALELERPILLGCSLGANLTLELASRRPGAYAAVVSAQGADHTPNLNPDMVDLFAANGQLIVGQWGHSLTGSRTSPRRRAEVEWVLSRATPEVMVADLRCYNGFDARERTPLIDCPVLLVRGDEDWLVPLAQVEATASRIPDVEIAELAGTGHHPMIENPQEFNEAVRGFLAKHDL